MNRFKGVKKRLVVSKLLLRNFFILASILAVFCIAFSIYTLRNSIKILHQEYLSSSQYNAEVLSESLDDYFMDMRYIAATLDSNDLVKTFFYSKESDKIINNIRTRIQEHLKAYVNSFASIDSIYLYSETAGYVITPDEMISLLYFTDTNWKEYCTDTPAPFVIFPRSKNNIYPYLICIVKQVKVKSGTAAIIINLDLSALPSLQEVKDNPYQRVFLINDEDKIIYRNNQRNLYENLDVIPELSHYKSGTNYNEILISKTDSPYSFVQIHSEEYPWNYVIITNHEEYLNRLSDNYAFLFTSIFILFCTAIGAALLFALHSFKPIKEILNIIENPSLNSVNSGQNAVEIKYIVDKITSYSQVNQDLSNELNARLNLLNETKLLALQSQINPHFLFNTINMIHLLEIEALGYDNPVPKITLSLSKLLRYAIESTDLVNLEVEIQYTKMYLTILSARYGNKLDTKINIAPEILSVKVPKLFIQPIIENAVFHGFTDDNAEHNTLWIDCIKKGGLCVLTVRDNGVGMKGETLEALRKMVKEQSPPNGSIGLKNIVARMTLLYGEKFNMTIDSTLGEGTTFTMYFPTIR